MKQLLLITIIFLQSTILFSQTNEIIVNNDFQYGFNRPRITLLSNNTPFVLWGKPGSSPKVYGTKLVGGNFTAPVQIVPNSMQPRVGSYDGPNIVSYNDSIYVVWGNENAANHHVFLNRSTDGGNSFGPAIQTDTVAVGDNIEYPGVSISNDGTLGIYFIKSDASWNNPRQSLIISSDRGNSFSKDSTVNSFAPGIPCECCQGSMEMQDTNWIFYYRNNVGNIRNTYSLVSKNTGLSFNNSYELDLVNWNIMSCPNSGPEGHINGNKSFTSWMSAGSGNSRVLYATVDIVTGTVSPATYIDASVGASVNQNYPCVSGSGDTIAVVWQDNRFIFSHIFTSISTDGGQTFSGSILLSDTSIISSYNAPDVAYANGIFHYVWKSNSKVIYKSTTLPILLSTLNEQTENINLKLYPNPASTELTINTELAIQKISIFDVSGKIIRSLTPATNTINISDLKNGTYFIEVKGKEKILTQKFVKE
ncbi:MAG: hypothetical protein COB15_03445 [Flavobacteriales bacterium]|nr:MAG: hypothetical protein COB15_03445 [Flavobacteriales bacterium]